MNIGIDGAPILGDGPRVPGLFHAVTSNGYTLAPLVGRITVDRGATDRDVGVFSVARFSDAAGRAPSSPIRSSPAMPEVAVRERLITGEAVFHEGGPPPAVPLRRGAIVTVVANPFAARYVDGAAVLPPDAAVEALRPQD